MAMSTVVSPVSPVVVCLRVCSDAGKRDAILAIEICLGVVAVILIGLLVRALLDWRWERRRRW